MSDLRATRLVAVLMLSLPCFAQAVASALPAVVPRSPDDVVPACRFVAIAREYGRADGVRQATLWEVPIDAPAVRRVAFGPSDWKPSPLLGSPALLRWQHPGHARRRYDVKIFAVDYKTFAVAELLAVAQATALGQCGDQVYLATSQGQRRLDLTTRKVAPLSAPLTVLAKHGGDWLVQTEGKVARFDAAKGRVVRRYDDLSLAGDFSSDGYVLWDGGRFAVRRGAYTDGDGGRQLVLMMGEWKSIFQELRVMDLESGVESKLRVRLSAMGGSGRPVIPMELQTELVGGMFRYTECRPETADAPDPRGFDWGEDVEWVTIDVASGKELLRRPYQRRDLGSEASVRGAASLPTYLDDCLANVPDSIWSTPDRLAAAFLDFNGVEWKFSSARRRKFDGVARSPDGQQLVVLESGRFHHCELKSQQLKTWQAPAALKKANVELYAIKIR